MEDEHDNYSVEEEIEEGRWLPLESGWLDEEDVAAAVGAISRRKREQTQAAMIHSGVLEEVLIPERFFNNVLFMKRLIEFSDMRREKGRRITKKVAERILEDFVEWGIQDSVQALEDALRGGWTGVYRPKRNGRTPPPLTDMDRQNLERLHQKGQPEDRP